MGERDMKGRAGSDADHALTAAAKKYAELEAKFSELSIREDAAPSGAAKDRMRRQLEENVTACERLRAAMSAIPAGGLAGLRAKAAVLRLSIDQAADGSGPYRQSDNLAWSLTGDIIAGAGVDEVRPAPPGHPS